MDPKNVKGPGFFWFKFSIERFVILKDLLTNPVIIIDMLFIGTNQSVIDQLLSPGKDCLPISKKKNIEKHVLRERKSSRGGLQRGLDCRQQGIHGSG